MAEADEAVFSDNLTRLSKALMAPNWIPGILEQIDQGSPDSEQTGRAIQRTTRLWRWKRELWWLEEWPKESALCKAKPGTG